MTRNATVAEMVRRRCPDADMLLELLGVAVDGVMQPDDDRDYGDVDTAHLGSTSKGGQVVSDDMLRRPEESSAPEALRNLPPVVVEVKPKKTGVRGGRGTLNDALKAAGEEHNKRKEAPCGTRAAKRRHKRRGEAICALCAPVPLTEPGGKERSEAYRRARGIAPRNWKKAA